MITLVDQRSDVRRELPLLPILLAVILRAGDWGDPPQAWGGQVEASGTDASHASMRTNVQTRNRATQRWTCATTRISQGCARGKDAHPRQHCRHSSNLGDCV
jgi:hypothetical protein